MKKRKIKEYIDIDNDNGYQITTFLTTKGEKAYELSSMGFDKNRNFFIGIFCFITEDKELIRSYAFALQRESIEMGYPATICADDFSIHRLIRKHKT